MNEKIKNISELKKIFYRKKLLSKYGIEKVGLFGSLARGESFKDIDILVENYKSNNSLLDFKNELETLTGKKVDLVIEKFANPIILFRAKKDLVYVKKYKK